MMDLHTLVSTVSSDHSDKLKCFSCKSYLSYFPISVRPNNQSICGRCTTDDVSVRNEAFETIAQFLKFPCRYSCEGCFEQHFPSDVPAHEEECPFRTVPCTVTKPQACNWKGALPNLQRHYEEEHSEVILNGEFCIDVSRDEECDNLVEHEGKFLIFTRKFDSESKVLRVAVYHSQYEDYQSQVNVNVNLDDKIVMLLGTSSFDKKVFNEMCLKYVTSDDTVTAKLTVGEKKQQLFERQKLLDIEKEVLDFLRCTECLNFVVPPIYICVESGDAIGSCCIYDHETDCHKCKKLDKPLINYTLEEIAKLVDYPCENHNDGCLYTARYHKIETHQNRCLYSTENCHFASKGFVKCTWIGLGKNLNHHILTHHEDKVIDVCEEITFDIKKVTKYSNCRVIKYCNTLFALMFSIVDKQYQWQVEELSYHEDHFKYEIMVTGSAYNGQRLIMGKQCAYYNEPLLEDKHICIFEESQVTPFTENQVLKFKVRIFKT